MSLSKSALAFDYYEDFQPPCRHPAGWFFTTATPLLKKAAKSEVLAHYGSALDSSATVLAMAVQCETGGSAFAMTGTPLFDAVDSPAHGYEMQYFVQQDSYGRKTVSATNFATQRQFIRTYIGQNWLGDWLPTATATPPVEHDLPLAEGVSLPAGMRCTFFRTQENVVTIHASVNFDFSDSKVIATVPAGFRPAYQVNVPCEILKGTTGERVVGDCVILTDGSITIFASTSGGTYASMFAVYLASPDA